MPWLKIGYFEDHALAIDWRPIAHVSDGPGRMSPHWSSRPHPSVGETRPTYGPSYEVGDELLVYASRDGRCPAILQVTAEPQWNPDAVDRDASAGDGDRWGMYTRVKLVHAVDMASAPLLETLGVPRASVARRGRLAIPDWVVEDARRALGAPPRRRWGQTVRPKLVPIEAGDVGSYDVRQPAGGTTAQRREQRLVRELADHLESLGHEVRRNEIPGDDDGAAMYSDLFDVTTRLLIEAKASTRRADVRMAIGQLADYSRAVKPKHQAVLLEARPHPDLVALLRTCRIAVIWRTGTSFASTQPQLIT